MYILTTRWDKVPSTAESLILTTRWDKVPSTAESLILNIHIYHTYYLCILQFMYMYIIPIIYVYSIYIHEF